MEGVCVIALVSTKKEKRGLCGESSARQAIYKHRVLVRAQTLGGLLKLPYMSALVNAQGSEWSAEDWLGLARPGQSLV